ncbi:5-hydroxytryptamine receptor 3A-like [Hyla sarda]|uniref:5-hydroxytryptamine receptor 3A-like n=1 Tax=Hyla sarda TaxID=327740 RepID=UPI0024C3E715|nr:5-hydroxytryptamine receptor 3A-like [Hyla sarda]XP_056382255.1 5-hydroxytryptamine receptor 3A-like [Hyla sarda]
MSLHRIILPLTVILLDKCHSVNNCSYNDLLQIVKKLPSSDVRPVKNWKTPTTVFIDLSLYTIVNLDTSLETLTTYIWFNMVWNNEFLHWNPDDFCDIEKMLIANKNFWLPDLYIYETIESHRNGSDIQYLDVSSNGTISLSLPLRIVSSCNLDLTKFPFDVQKCTLSFGPYIHSVEDINMVTKLNSTQVFQNSKNIFSSKGDWYLHDITVENSTFLVNNVTYSQVVYEISIKRASVIFVINLIIPVCFLVILDIASMFIHFETGERLDFKIAVVLGFSVLLLILNTMLPASDTLPVLGIFCCVCLAVMVTSTVGCIATSYMFMLSKTKQNVPRWVKIWIMKYLARVLFFKVHMPQQAELVSAESAEKGNRVHKNTEICMTIEVRKTKTQTDAELSVEVKLLKKLLVEVLNIRKKITCVMDQDGTESDWHFASKVVDRLFLIFYLLFAITMLAVVIKVWVT